MCSRTTWRRQVERREQSVVGDNPVIAFPDCQEFVLPKVKPLPIYSILWDIQYPSSDFFLNKTQAHLQDFEPVSKPAPTPVPSRTRLLVTWIFSAFSLQVMVQTFLQIARFTLPISLTLLDLSSIHSLIEILISSLLTSFLLAFMNTSSEIKYK